MLLLTCSLAMSLHQEGCQSVFRYGPVSSTFSPTHFNFIWFYFNFNYVLLAFLFEDVFAATLRRLSLTYFRLVKQSSPCTSSAVYVDVQRSDDRNIDAGRTSTTT